MKKTILLMVLVTTFLLNQNVVGQATDLIISEYIEGSSYHKAVEIYNGTGGSIDLSGYELWRISNGGSWPEATQTLSGILLDGQVFVVHHPDAGEEITAEGDLATAFANWNGDDAVGLAKDIEGIMTLIDAIGTDGEDPGSGWDVAGISNATKDHTLVRKADICSPTTDWATSAGTNVTDSQWIVYDQNDFDYIGAHTSNCSGPTPLSANFTASDQTIYPGEMVTFSDLTSGGEEPYSLEWDLDGNGTYETTGPDPQFTYNTAGKYTIRLRVTDNVTTIDIEEKLDYISVTEPLVSNIADLRAGDLGQNYTLTGEAILTYQQTYRNQKYIEDATAAILIDDDDDIITTIYELYDGITGIEGTLSEYGNMTQFVPLSDPGTATSNGNIVTPQVVTIDDLNDSFDDYEAELVQLFDISFTDVGVPFENGTVYSISDESKALGEFRTTFWDVDYIGTSVPAIADIVVLPNARSTGNYITSRSLADMEGESNPPTQLHVFSVNGGTNPYTNVDFDVVVQVLDEFDNLAEATSEINFSLSSTSGTVDFVGGTTTSGTIPIGEKEVTLYGVRMAPAGDNVTIIASHNIIIDPLDPGESLPFNVVDYFEPELIITEVIPNPAAVTDANGEWFEIFNNSTIEADLNGFVIKDNDYDSITIVGSVIVPSKGFAILGNNADAGTNGGYTCNYEYSNMSLSNSGDELVICMPDGLTELDRIEWGSGWPAPNGSSMVFTGFPDEDNNVGSEWVYATFREASYTFLVDTLDAKAHPVQMGMTRL